jgi:hypothetical protein
VVNAIARHHEPTGSLVADSPVLLAVHAANVLDYQAHPDQAKVGPAPKFDAAFLKACGVEDQLEDWRKLAF